MGIFGGCSEKKSYVPFNSEKCIRSLKIYQNFILSFFLLIKMEWNPYITSILVYCCVQCLFCFKLVARKVQEVPQ